MLEALLSRFNSAPVLIAPEQEAVFKGCLSALTSQEDGQKLLSERASHGEDFWFPADDYRARYRPYIVRDGILQIPVRGVLLHDFPWSYGSYATGYTYIWKAYERGMADPMVRGIALMIHSPGGEVAGNFDLVDKMFAMRDTKPVRAFAHEYAYSAAYSIASVADHIAMSRTGGVGSIGVLTMHVDVSKMVTEMGYKITFIFAGKHKVDGNSFEPLPNEVKERIQARIDGLYDVFVATVARNRGMEDAAVRATEALTFSPDEALSNGLADSVGPLDDAVAAFAADLTINEGDETMSDSKDKVAVDQAAVTAARTEGHTAGVAEGTASGMKAGAKAERERISTILASDNGKLRPAAAMAAAMDTDMTVEQATAFLAKLPEEKTETKAETVNPFKEAMDKTKQPDLGAGGETEASVPDSIFASAGIAKKTA